MAIQYKDKLEEKRGIGRMKTLMVILEIGLGLEQLIRRLKDRDLFAVVIS